MNNYNTQDNKELLWNLMQENQLFNGLNENQYNKVINTFESIVLRKSSQNQFVSVTEFNKDVITNMITELNRLKSKKLEMIYSSEDRMNQRQNEFDNSFKQKEQEMHSLLQPKTPENINFQDDNTDKPIGENMDRMLADMIASREQTLEFLPTNKKEAEEWINKDSQSNNNQSNNNQSNNNQRKNDNDKKVTFQVLEENSNENNNEIQNDNNPLNSFIKKLKKSENIDSNNNNNNNNNDLLDEIENDIINLLQKIKKLKNS
tara:strand:+ start:2506 stop:3288 length:783 start_codon:yes stop_codon:yes gene_type:complete